MIERQSLARHLPGARWLLAATALLAVSPAVAQDELPAQLVAALHGAFGDNHARAVHAKGIVLTGSFTPDAGARTLSKAAIFTRPTPVTVRFSDFTGLPNIPDADPNASPR
ncbi:MAG: catalase, partial [Janthinobacterium lividum]